MAIGTKYRVAAACLLIAVASDAAAAASLLLPETAKLAPHRAVYDLELGGTRGASSVAAVQGRLVFEFTGSACEGFTQNMRFVMNISNRDGGANLSDLRSTTWETPDGGKYRFSFNDFQNQESTDETKGDAVRDGQGGSVAVSLAKPALSKVSLTPGTLFPVQHTIHLLAAALRGDHLMAADLYDGSDKGQKSFFTNSIIGPVRPAGPDAGLELVKNAERLAGLKSWPVTIAYYDAGSDKAEGIPAHEMSFVLYENGVIRKLGIDYGTLSVKGTLAEIEFYEPGKCPN